jgi:hypothetical protein
MIVLFLSGLVAMIMVRTLRRDFQRYEQQVLFPSTLSHVFYICQKFSYVLHARLLEFHEQQVLWLVAMYFFACVLYIYESMPELFLEYFDRECVLI